MCFVKVQGRKEVHWVNLMKNDGKGVPLRWHNMYAIEVWRCPMGQGKTDKIHETWSHDPWAGSNWAFDERLSGSNVVSAVEAADCTRCGEDLGLQCSPFPPSGKPFLFPHLGKLVLFLQLLLKDHLLQEAFLDHMGWVREPSSGHLLLLGCPRHSTYSTAWYNVRWFELIFSQAHLLQCLTEWR